MSERERCGWSTTDPLYIEYHDTEWGVPVYDDADMFERLMLEGFQAGLSWITILRKRENFAAAFDNWDAEKIAAYGEVDVARLMSDAGIIRNRLKIRGAIQNAQAYLDLRAGGESFSEFLWSFVGGMPKINHPATLADIPAITDEAIAMSKALKKRGFTFVGPTICYAHMQSAGLVDDHVITCFRAQTR
jgi:DNA-3-methyladenine glycosylase I